jgi:hypothetical protein
MKEPENRVFRLGRILGQDGQSIGVSFASSRGMGLNLDTCMG